MIALVYDDKSYDEIGIEIAAKNMGIKLVAVNFLTSSFPISKKLNFEGAINRCLSKGRREKASLLFESHDIPIINSTYVEQTCNSKFQTMVSLSKNSVPIPKTSYIPFNVERSGGEVTYRPSDVNKVITQMENEFSYPFVLKPDRGSRGRDIKKVENKKQLESIIKNWIRTLDNPAGMLVQECIAKNFDMRIVIAKENKKTPEYIGTLARVASRAEDFTTNTALGALPIGIEIPDKIKKAAIKASESVSNDSDIFLLGIDGIPSLTSAQIEKVFSLSRKLVPTHENIRKIKRTFSNSANLSKEKFLKMRESLDSNFSEFMKSNHYQDLKSELEDIASVCEVKFLEVNSRPDYYINTRNSIGVDLSEKYLNCINSLV